MKPSPHPYPGPDRSGRGDRSAAVPGLPGRRGLIGGLLATAALAAAGPAVASPARATARRAPTAGPRATRPLLLGTYTSEAGAAPASAPPRTTRPPA